MDSRKKYFINCINSLLKIDSDVVGLSNRYNYKYLILFSSILDDFINNDSQL